MTIDNRTGTPVVGKTLEASRVEEGVAYEVAYDDGAATTWRQSNCTRGDGRRFGGCAVEDGIVLQERAGEAVLLAVAFDVRAIGPDSETALTVVVEIGASDD